MNRIACLSKKLKEFFNEKADEISKEVGVQSHHMMVYYHHHLRSHYGTSITWMRQNNRGNATMGPKQPRSTVLTKEEEAIIVTFRKHTLLPLDDCLYSLQATIPHLTRSSLHRCLQRHGISRLPDVEGEVKAKKKFKQYPIGYFHIDIAEVRTEEGKLQLFVAIDRTSKFAYVELHNSATKPIAAEFLRNLIKILPYKIHTILTDNGILFTNQEPPECDSKSVISGSVVHQEYINLEGVRVLSLLRCIAPKYSGKD
ncbi:Ribonuclease H-like domain,Integrase, catalytic core [Cinara cedri]|uniref:Ribonuclease H-like domain,Integrase, catalytic core n=1 Tax=Cinara cedri TaxID=506608 RepID=A0A5E4MHW4_9HEMI|nr:Ribonuclease H-like domain,Integrase, catalytic core [Cinara cedri]